jgi:hypothetical protein
MKKITVHGLVADNAGDMHDANAVLTVDDEGGAGCITAQRADQLLKIHSASVHHHDQKAGAKPA